MADRFSRPNTLEEKRRMRSSRKKRRRSRVKVLEEKLCKEKAWRTEATKKLALYQGMSKSFWERWQWELQERRESMKREKVLLSSTGGVKTCRVLKLPEIEPQLLCNPPSFADDESTYVGRGSFGLVRVQLYRGMLVAVKEFLPHSTAVDVRNEAKVLSTFCHPYLPFLFGVNTAVRPFMLVMQYHTFKGESVPTTLRDALCKQSSLLSERVTVMLCIQLMEAMRYLHDEAGILHNDLKCNNIILCNSFTDTSSRSSNSSLQIIVIDFGKATTIGNGKIFTLNNQEKAEYARRFPHIPQEVREGITSQTKMSDVFSAGCIIKKMSDSSIMRENVRRALSNVAIVCCATQYLSRPSAQDVLKQLTVICE